jgi:hypothetical protein
MGCWSCDPTDYGLSVLHAAYGNFAIDAVMTNMKTNSTFPAERLSTLAPSSGVGYDGGWHWHYCGWQPWLVAITGSAAGVGGAAQFLFRKTGTAAYSVYRIA